MRTVTITPLVLAIAVLATGAWTAVPGRGQPESGGATAANVPAGMEVGNAWGGASMESPGAARFESDVNALRTFRPGYLFWQHIFTIPDGSIAFGSARDGRLLAVFPARGDWARAGRWEEPTLASVLAGHRLEAGLSQRRDQMATLLRPEAGQVLHNATRGNFLLPNARRYGGFLREWGAIYERFGVPAEIGLAQAVLESGLNGKVQSEARAVGFCQWLPQNWARLNRLAPHVLEAQNQTTQAPYCAAYLSVLATKYGSFIPALSEHHAGGTNVARAVINGGRLGGRDAREQYLLGSRLARDLREISSAYRELYGTYGPRSYLYAEMVFGNTVNVRQIEATVPQEQIYAMRTRRAIPLSEITRRTGLTADQVRRFNPALVRQVPARADLFLPRYVSDFGADVAFGHRAPSAEYEAVLGDFLRLEASVEEWHSRSFRPVVAEFRRRFQETSTEEGRVMATVLAYVAEEMYTGRRPEILAEYVSNPVLRELFAQGLIQREALASSRGCAFSVATEWAEC